MNSKIRYRIRAGTKDSNVALERNTLKVCVYECVFVLSVVEQVCVQNGVKCVQSVLKTG